MLTSTFSRKIAVKWAEKTNEAVKWVQDDGLNILHTEAEDISIKVECNQVSICCICLRRNARPCCSLMETSVTFLTTIRDSWNLPASPSPHLPASATISETYPDLICHLHRPLLWVRARPTCRCRSGTERRGSGRTSWCCIWKSGRFREAKLRRSCWCSAFVTMHVRNHRAAVAVLDPHGLFLWPKRPFTGAFMFHKPLSSDY